MCGLWGKYTGYFLIKTQIVLKKIRTLNVLQMLGLSEAAKHAHIHILQMLGLSEALNTQPILGLQMLGLSEAAKHAHMHILQMLGLSEARGMNQKGKPAVFRPNI